MRHYETAFLITPKLEEEEIENLIQKMADVIKKNKGKMVNIERWGKRKLTYPINGLEEAFYIFFHYQGDTVIPTELERRFRQNEAIIRYLTLKKEFQDSSRQRAKTMKEEKREAEEERKEKEFEEEEEILTETEKSSEEN